MSQADGLALAGTVNAKLSGALASAVVAVLLGADATWAVTRG